MKKKSYLAFPLAVVIFFSFGSRIFGINGEHKDEVIVATLSLNGNEATESKSLTITINDAKSVEKMLPLWQLGAYEANCDKDKEVTRSTKVCVKIIKGTVSYDMNTGGSLHIILNTVNNKRADELSSCDCYDKNAKKTKHYDGSSEMYKEVMCHYQCCLVDKEYGFQWGGNTDPSAFLEQCRGGP